VTFISPEAGQKPRLMAVISATNRPAKKHESSVILTGSEDLPGVPRECRSVKGDEYEPGLGARDQQRGIIQAQPRSVLPVGNVNDGKLFDQAPAG
jgi:hypothetical protein